MPDQPSEASGAAQAAAPGPPPPPEVTVAPGWYSLNQRGNSQSYWDGERWAKTRQWRGTGWVEDGGDPAFVGAEAGAGVGAGAGAGAAGAGAAPPRVSRYLPPSARMPSSYPPSGYPPMMGGPPMTPRPMVQTTNGSAVASLVLSVLGLCGIGSLLGIIFGHRARREIRQSGGYQGGDGLALAGIIVGYVSLVLWALVILLWIGLFVTIHNHADSASSSVNQCQGDIRSVAVAVDAYHAQKGSFPEPPAAWTAQTYTSNYAPLTSGVGGGPYLHVPPATGDYVIEYDSLGNVWVAPPGNFETAMQPDQTLAGNSADCQLAVSG